MSTAIKNLAGNMLLFSPMGLFIPLLFGKRIRSFWAFLLVMVVIIIFVEIIQFLTVRGSFDIDDVNNGQVKIRNIDVLPTWVQKGESYRIIPLDDSIASEEWPTFDEEAAVVSYNRTMGRLGEAYIKYK